jgi:predicted nucleotide-binding protein (sugar kinase/HSP70/actin superfamily)
LGAEIVTSPDTNREILNEGVKICIDDACLPVKIFHGHIAYLKNKCDFIFIPRIMELAKGEFICPKFCGLTELVKNDFEELPELLGEPIYAYSEKKLKKWAQKTGKKLNRNFIASNKALKAAIEVQNHQHTGIDDTDYKIKVALVGHPYNIYDKFINMNVIKKLNKFDIGVITEENINPQLIEERNKDLFKKPFWTFAKNSYGFSTHLAENKSVQGIVYLSSFSCGIDSVVIELIKDKSENLPLLILKLDEHTGEAGFDTRIEAFSDMLSRSC